MSLTGAAAARLYDDHVDAVHALIARRVGSEASPGIVAETFEHALHSWDRFDRQRGTERLFLFGAAVAVLRRHLEVERAHLRTLDVGRDVPSAVTVVDPLVGGAGRRSPRVVRHEANQDLVDDEEPSVSRPGSALMIAVADLAPDDRDVVLLSLWESCSQSAIGEVLELSVGTVRSTLSRVRRELKAAVASTQDPS